jgi:hypothetical protein
MGMHNRSDNGRCARVAFSVNHTYPHSFTDLERERGLQRSEAHERVKWRTMVLAVLNLSDSDDTVGHKLHLFKLIPFAVHSPCKFHTTSATALARKKLKLLLILDLVTRWG